MFSRGELAQIRRRKRSLIAHSDRLRTQSGEIWGAAERRTKAAENRRLGRVTWVRPLLSYGATIGLFILKQKNWPGRPQRWLSPVLSTINLMLDLQRNAGQDGRGIKREKAREKLPEEASAR
jgi:hypothetical protein